MPKESDLDLEKAQIMLKLARKNNWGAKYLKLGTLRAVVRQLGLDWQEFLNAK